MEVGPASPPDSQVLVDTIFTNMLPETIHSSDATSISDEELVQLTLKELYPNASPEALAERTSASTLGRLVSELLSLQRELFHQASCAYSIRLFTSRHRAVFRAQRLEKLDNRVQDWARPHLRKEQVPPDPGWRLERAARCLCSLEMARESRLISLNEDILACPSLCLDVCKSFLFHAPEVIGCLSQIHVLGVGLSRLLQTVSSDSAFDQTLLFAVPSDGEAISSKELVKGSKLHLNALRMGLGVEWIELTALNITRLFNEPPAELLLGIDLRMETQLIAFLLRSVSVWLESFRKRKWSISVEVVERNRLRQQCTEVLSEVADHLLSSVYHNLKYVQSLKSVSSVVVGISSTKLPGSTRTVLPASLGLDCISPPSFISDSSFQPPPEAANGTLSTVWEALFEVHGILQVDALELIRSLEPLFCLAEKAEDLLHVTFDEDFTTMSLNDIIAEDKSILYATAKLVDDLPKYYQAMEEFVQLRIEHLHAISLLHHEAMFQLGQVETGVFLLPLTDVKEDMLQAIKDARMKTVESLMTILVKLMTLVEGGLGDIVRQVSLTPSNAEEVHSYQCLLSNFEDKVSQSNVMHHYGCAKVRYITLWRSKCPRWNERIVCIRRKC